MVKHLPNLRALLESVIKTDSPLDLPHRLQVSFATEFRRGFIVVSYSMLKTKGWSPRKKGPSGTCEGPLSSVFIMKMRGDMANCMGELRWGTFQQTQASMPLSRLQQVNELSQIWHRRSRLGPYLTTVGVEACSSNRHPERFSSLAGYLAAAHSTYAEPSSSPTCCGVELHVFFSRRFSSLFRLGCGRCGTNFFFFANSSDPHETT